MLYTLLLWSYILITCFICGFFVLSRIVKDRISFGGCIICGITVLTAYSEYFSLFSGVGLIANIILIVGCFAFFSSDLKKYPTLIRKKDGPVPVVVILSAVIVIVCAYFTAAGSFTYDTGTYHAQSIHWIESYGLVKGLAHMQTRLGFNSAYFPLCALYSFSFTGRSMHVMSGFLGVFTMVYSLFGLLIRPRKEGGTAGLRVSDMAYIAPFAYFVIIAVEIISPSTDHGVIWLILWLLIKWIECMEDEAGQDKIPVYALLSVFAVFLVTVKLSVGVLAVIVLYPLYYLLKEKNYVDVLKYVFMGFILVLPFFIRNYFITGWLVYPFPSVDLFSPDWKIPLEGVKHEADEIVVWARYTKDTALIDQSIVEWFPVWWQEQGASNRLLSVAAFSGSVLLLLRTVISLIVSALVNKRTVRDGGYLFFGSVLLISFLFFMISAPSNRFGYGYILMVPLYAVGDLLVNCIIKERLYKKKTGICLTVIIAAVSGCAMLMFGRGIYRFASDDKQYVMTNGLSSYEIKQKDYPEADALSKEWEGMTIYYPRTEGDQIWYHAFPAILYEGNLEGTMRRGDDIRDGFKLK